MTAPLSRLAVELAIPNGGLVNKIANATGAGGSVANWITPVAGSAMTATATTGGVNDHGIAGDKLIYTAAGGVANYFYSAVFPVTATHYAAARWKARYVDGYYSQRIEWLAADKTTVVGSSIRTGARQATGATWAPTGPQAIPGTAVYARIRFDLYSTAAGGNPGAGDDLILQDVQLVTATTAAALGTRRINYITNADAEDPDTTAGPTGGAHVVTSQATLPKYGTRAYRLVGAGAGANVAVRWDVPTGGQTVPAGVTKITHAASVRAPAGETVRQFRTEVTVRVGGVDTILTSAWYNESNTAYVDALDTFTLPAGNVAIREARIVFSSLTTSERHHFDGWQLVIGDTLGTMFHQLTPAAGGFVYEVNYASNNTSTYGAVEHTFTADVVTSPVTWEEITGAHAEVKITRKPLDAGTLATVLKSEQLPAGFDPEVKPGAGYRVLLDTYPLIETAITGREPRGDTKSGQPPIAVAGADAGRVLVAASKPSGVGTLADLAWTLEDTGVPWLINGSGAQVASPTVTATNANAKAIDQIAMTRDLAMPAYAWVSRPGPVVINDAAHLDPAEKATIDETDYSYFEQGYDPNACINIVTVKVGATTYGPYRDQASIDAWGEHPCTLTLQGVTSTVAQTVAGVLLAANSSPAYQVIAVTVPISRADQDPIALLDLYDLVRVQHAATGTDQLLRVAQVVHEITPRKWLVKLRFVVPGVAAIPQVIPEP